MGAWKDGGQLQGFVTLSLVDFLVWTVFAAEQGAASFIVLSYTAQTHKGDVFKS